MVKRTVKRLWRGLRREWNRRTRSGLAIVYTARYQRSLPGVPVDPLRGEKIVASLEESGLLRARSLSEPLPASVKNLLRVHTDAYLQALQGGAPLSRAYGTPIADQEADALVELHRLQVGGTIHATRLALQRGVGVHLGGGFHHALPESGLGFCVFNDVAVAIKRLRAKGFASSILVVDLDLHDGNGTRAVFADDPTVHTYSVHNEHWGPTEAVESTSLALGTGVDDVTYLDAIRQSLPPIAQRFRPGLVFYLAGADPAEDDAMGDWHISPEALLARDRLVTSLFRGRAEDDVPLVIVLAGGYGPAAWRYGARYLLWLASGTELALPDEASLTLRRYRRIGVDVLTDPHARDDDGLAFSLTTDDLVGLTSGERTATLFLGTLTGRGVEHMLERLGILEQLRARGFRRLRVEVAPDEGRGDTLRVVCEDLPAGELLVELRVARSRAAVPGFEVITVDWILLQNPRARFHPRRTRLPDQQYPGLGLLREVFGWLLLLGEALGLDGLAFTAGHYHVAIQSHRVAFCLDPADGALLRDVRSALRGVHLSEATFAVAERRLVREDDGARVPWRPLFLGLPISDRFRRHLEAAERRTRAIPPVAYRLSPGTS